MEREGVSTLYIHSFLRALICLDHLKKYLVLLCVLKIIFENALVRQFAL